MDSCIIADITAINFSINYPVADIVDIEVT